MRKFLRIAVFVFVCFFFAKTAQAQYVIIPDANFRDWLRSNYGFCMNGNALDTTCSIILNVTSLNLNSGYDNVPMISDLTGVQYFKSLRYLDCSNNTLTVLPVLPESLDTLLCFNNQLVSLPALPGKLRSLACDNNLLTALPELPNVMNSLSCGQNPLTVIPKLPDSLTYFNLYYNTPNNTLTSLPFLPNGITQLEIYNTSLTRLPNLPDSVTDLYCTNNNLASLPPLPAGLLYLWCDNNQLTSLPDLPGKLIDLSCQSNPISCLPFLPNSLELVNIYFQTNITCLPNKPSRADINAYTDPMPICDSYPGNPSGCTILPYLRGIVFNDKNKNGIQDSGENGMENVKLVVQPGNYMGTTDTSGVYKIIVDTMGTYAMNVYTQDYSNYTITPSSQTSSFNHWGQIDSMQAFAMQPISSMNDLSITLTPITYSVVPGKLISYFITYSNIGTTTMSGTVQLNADPSLVYQGGSSYTAQSANTLTYNYSDLEPYQSNNLIVSFTVPTTLPAGTLLNFSAAINPISGDDTPSNNTDVLQQTVVSSYDPNLKHVSPVADISLDDVFNQQPFTYTVYFQNTGTDTAFTIVVKDSIDINFEVQEIQTLASSSPCSFAMKNHAAQWTFNNILLPDSTENEPASHGFVRYRVIPKNTLQAGDEITNTANIYFDYNAPVATNTTMNRVGTTTTATLNYSNPQNNIVIYPNPSTGIFQISSNSKATSIDVINIMSLDGRVIYTADNVNLTSGLSIDLSSQPDGMYLVQVVQGGEINTGKIIIK